MNKKLKLKNNNNNLTCVLVSGYLSNKGELRKEISSCQVFIISQVEQISSHFVSSPGGTCVRISTCLACLGWSSLQTLFDRVNSSMSFFRFLPGVSDLLEADHIWPITLPKGPVGLNQCWKPLYCCGATIKNVFTLLYMPLCTFIIQQCILFFSLP